MERFRRPWTFQANISHREGNNNKFSSPCKLFIRWEATRLRFIWSYPVGLRRRTLGLGSAVVWWQLFQCLCAVLQAEKKIRLQSLVKMGFLMNEFLMNIFKRCNDATVTAVQRSGDNILQIMDNYGVNCGVEFDGDDADQSTIFYTAGAIVRSFLRKSKCSTCITMLSRNNESLPIRLADPVPPMRSS